MNHNNGGDRGFAGNYPPNQQGAAQYPSSSNNMQYNYTMNQPYAANMNNMYPDQYYPQQDGGYQGYPQENYEEDDYDNLDEIERELTKGGSADFEQEMLQAMDSPSYGHHQRHFEPHGGHGGHSQNRAGPYVPQAAVPTQNGKLSSFAVSSFARTAMKSNLASMSRRSMSTTPFVYQELFDLAPDKTTKYKKLTDKHVSTVEVNGMKFLKVEPEALRLLSAQAMTDIAHLLRPAHLEQLSKILKDPEATENDRFVALELLKNANIAANFVLPGCQDTGTAIVSGKRGQYVLTDGNDEEHLSKGVYDTYTGTNLRYSQVAPVDMFKEVNTKTNLPAQIDLYASKGGAYEFLFIAKGGGSANKTYLYQQTKALLNPASLMKFLEDNIKTIGTSACPPYHLAIVIGGLSAEQTLKTVKMASTKYYDTLPTTGNEHGRAFRDLETEKQVLEMCQKMGIGAQFGGKYFCHDVRVVRLPRHGASCPVGLGVSCSADRQIKGKITSEGVFLEQLETNVGKYLPEVKEEHLSATVVNIDINRPMKELRETLSKLPVTTRLNLSGTMIVARDIAHAKLLERVQAGQGLPDYAKNYMIYYAGPAKTPEGYASGSFGPTTAGRMDAYVDTFMANGGSFITLAKGNRSKQVTAACKKHGGFYLGSIGGPAAVLAQNCIKKVEVLEYPELGMEAIWKIDVVNFPAFVVVDDKGNDFFAKWIPN